MEIKMTNTRATKGTIVYEATDPSAAVTTLYLRKIALGDAIPDAIVVKIETAAA